MFNNSFCVLERIQQCHRCLQIYKVLVVCTLQHFPLYTSPYAIYSVHDTLYIPALRHLYHVQFPLLTLSRISVILYFVQFTLYTSHCTHHPVHYTTPCTLHPQHLTLQTSPCTLYPLYFTP